MKTAISIPDKTFQAAENFAQRLGISRSELYAKAIFYYLERHKRRDITKELNEIYENSESEVDTGLHSLQIRSLQQED